MLEGLNLVELWKDVWSLLGPFFAIILFILLLHPEMLEKVVIYLLRAFSRFSERAERRAVSREVTYIVSTNFAKNYRLEEVPKVAVKWGEEDEAILDLRRNMLVIVLRRGKKSRHENIARAVLKAIPELLTPEMKVVYNPRLVDCLSAHIARSLVRNYQPVVTAINEFTSSEIEKDEGLREVASMLVEIDDQSLLSRILLPELIKVAKLRYPHRDPQIDDEALDLIKTLHGLVKGEASKPMLCGKYFRVLFVRVARPEKIMLEPHLQFVKHSFNKCPTIETVYTLAAGANIAAAKVLKTLLEREFRSLGLRLKVKSEEEYMSMYRKKPQMKLYVCGIEIERAI
jgi:hypothetical protein